MRLASTSNAEAGKGERNDFSKARTLTEGLKRRAAIAAVALGLSMPIGCGGSGPDTDAGGSGGDAGSMSDGGTGGDGGSGGDGGGSSLCTMYPEGHANRVVFGVQGNNIQVPAQNTENRRMFLRKIENIGGADYGTFGVYNQSSPSTPPTYTGVPNGGSRVIEISTNVGVITLQICTMTLSPCSVGTPGSTPLGDANCTISAAADRPWGLP